MWLFLLKAQLVSYILEWSITPVTRAQAHDTFDEGNNHGSVDCK
jgi:hypothetical protein